MSSLDQLEDPQGNMGLFFLFPDVSIRWRGRFQLGITLLRIARRVMIVGVRMNVNKLIISFSPDFSGLMAVSQQGQVLAEARTRTFDVLAHNQYSAVRVSFSLCLFHRCCTES